MGETISEDLNDYFWREWQDQFDMLFNWPHWIDWVLITVSVLWFGRPLLYRLYLGMRGEHINDNP